MRIVFFGTPKFAAEILEFLIKKNVTIAAVVTRTDKPKGRSKALIAPPVKLISQKYHIPVHQPRKASEPDFAETLAFYKPDLFVVVAYGEIVQQHVLDIPSKASINVHTSLLPKYRGAAPVQRAVINGEHESGISIMHMVKKMDAGPIIRQRKVTIEPDMTFGELEEELCEIGKVELLEVIKDFDKGNVQEVEQDESKVTFAPKIQREDCKIYWEKSAQEIHNLIRGVNPYPGAWSIIIFRGQNKRFKILESKIGTNSGVPGEIIEFGKDGFCVACGTGSLYLTHVQLEGKSPMSSQDFCRGYQISDLEFIKG